MKLIRELHPTIRAIDAKTHTIEFVASDETLDCYSEIIRAAGWKFDVFKGNPVLVDSHDYSSIEKQLGRVTEFRVEGGQLIERAQLAADVPENRLARLAWQMAEKGYLRACSVGFMPTKYASKWDSDKSALLSAIAELKLSADQAALVRTIYLEQQQIELSLCCIGANPNALAKAHTDGAVSDADLAALGFDDDGLTFLHEAASAYSAADLLTRHMLDREVRRLTFRKTTPQPATPAFGSAAAEEAKQQKRTEFLRKFRNLTKS